MKLNKTQLIFWVSCISFMMSCEAPVSNVSKVEVFTQPLQVVVQDSIKLIPAKELVYYHDEPFTGTSVAHYNANQQSIRIDYLNGKKHGQYKKWFRNGILSFDSTYKLGKKERTTKTWWKDGKIRSESNFTKGKANGDQLEWYKSGEKFKHRRLVDGQEQGMQQSWRKNGKIYNNYEAKNGRIFGLKRATLCYGLEDEDIQYKED